MVVTRRRGSSMRHSIAIATLVAVASGQEHRLFKASRPTCDFKKEWCPQGSCDLTTILNNAVQIYCTFLVFARSDIIFLVLFATRAAVSAISQMSVFFFA